MSKINIEISSEYREYLDLLKQIIPDKDGAQIKDDGTMVEVLVDTFISFIQEQATHNDSHGGHSHGSEGHVHGPNCNH